MVKGRPEGTRCCPMQGTPQDNVESSVEQTSMLKVHLVGTSCMYKYVAGCSRGRLNQVIVSTTIPNGQLVRQGLIPRNDTYVG